eukprot:TRINITY_DN2175_c0_g1_i4.p1 TRINITY_DN2175_c0_g1~~TRINITY_DN2175_c0_g1_i4.p1  ORF type:complete len:640 (+),score=130.98 TRINITY_DN2175_c0_g1_i4:393-2312(+)
MVYSFRGEALHSLCCVADVEIVSMKKGDKFATKVTFGKDGKEQERKEVPARVGTEITARNLFKCHPVRLEMLSKEKQCKADFSKMHDIVLAYTLIHPRITFKLKCQPERALRRGALKTIREALDEQYGPFVTKQLQEVDVTNPDGKMRITGFLPKPNAEPLSTVMRRANDRNFLYVNQRPVDIPRVSKLVTAHLKKWFQVENRRYFFVLLNFSIAADKYDVNLVPDKRQIAFTDEDLLRRSMESLLKGLFPVVATTDDDAPLTKVDDDDDTEPATQVCGASPPKAPVDPMDIIVSTQMYEQSSRDNAAADVGSPPSVSPQKRPPPDDPNVYSRPPLKRSSVDAMPLSSSPLPLPAGAHKAEMSPQQRHFKPASAPVIRTVPSDVIVSLAPRPPRASPLQLSVGLSLRELPVLKVGPANSSSGDTPSQRDLANAKMVGRVMDASTEAFGGVSLVLCGDHLLVMNVSRAEESLIYNRLCATTQLEKGELASPVRVNVDPVTWDVLARPATQNMLSLSGIDVDVQPQDRTVIVQSKPKGVSGLESGDELRRLLDDFVAAVVTPGNDGATVPRPLRVSQLLLERAVDFVTVSISRWSTGSGAKGATEDALAQLSKLHRPLRCCPHGKPIFQVLCGMTIQQPPT